MPKFRRGRPPYCVALISTRREILYEEFILWRVFEAFSYTNSKTKEYLIIAEAGKDLLDYDQQN